MPVFAILAAGLLAAPLPNAEEGTRFADYPQEYLRAEKSAAAFVEMVIDPDGRIVQCREVEIFGDPQFARRLCSLQRPRSWLAAKDEAGRPAYGVVRSIVRMYLPNTAQGTQVRNINQGPTAVLTVNRLPEPNSGFLDVTVSLKIDAAGKVTGCAPRPGQAVPAGYASMACEQMQLLPIPGAVLNGKPLESFVIQNRVRFVVKANKPDP